MPSARAETVNLLQQRLTHLVRQVAVPRAHEVVVDRAEVDLELVEAVVLSRIVDAGAIRLSDLARRMTVGSSTAGRHATRLAERGLCARAVDPVDGRAVVVTPTEEGREVVARLRSAHRAILDELLDDWSTSELAVLTDLLGRLGDDLGVLTEPVPMATA